MLSSRECRCWTGLRIQRILCSRQWRAFGARPSPHQSQPDGTGIEDQLPSERLAGSAKREEISAPSYRRIKIVQEPLLISTGVSTYLAPRRYDSPIEIDGLLEALQEDLSVARPEHTREPYRSQLPQSFLMDPNLLRARNRYRGNKTRPGVRSTRFEVALEKNPYAMMLGSPIRNCMLTSLRLPVDLLVPLTLRMHPTTGGLWQMPRGFGNNIRQMAKRLSKENPADTDEATGKEDSTAEKPHASPKWGTEPVSNNHILGTFAALDHLTHLPQRTYHRTIPHSWRTSFPSAFTKGVVCRKDMAALVLVLMRDKATKTLKYLASRDLDYVAPYCPPVKPLAYEPLAQHNRAWAVLWLGSSGGGSGSSEWELRDMLFAGHMGERDRLFDLVPKPDGRRIPVYDMTRMLDADGLTTLRKSHDVFAAEAVVLRGKRSVRECLKDLWGLCGYLGAAPLESVGGDVRPGGVVWADWNEGVRNGRRPDGEESLARDGDAPIGLETFVDEADHALAFPPSAEEPSHRAAKDTEIAPAPAPAPHPEPEADETIVHRLP